MKAEPAGERRTRSAARVLRFPRATQNVGASCMSVTNSIRNNVAIITLSRPDKLNAVTHDMILRLREAVSLAEQDSAIVGIVITGAGRAFCAGLDMDALSQSTAGARGGQA